MSEWRLGTGTAEIGDASAGYERRMRRRRRARWFARLRQHAASRDTEISNVKELSPPQHVPSMVIASSWHEQIFCFAGFVAERLVLKELVANLEICY